MRRQLSRIALVQPRDRIDRPVRGLVCGGHLLGERPRVLATEQPAGGWGCGASQPRTQRAPRSIPLTGCIAAGEGAVWVTTQHPHNAVWRLDPRTNETVAVIPVPPTSRRVAAGAGYVWVTSGTYAGEPRVPQRGGVVSKIDPGTNRIVATIKVGFRPDGVAVADGHVWVAVAPRR